MRLGEIVQFAANAGIEEERNEIVITLLNIFSVHGNVVLAAPLKERLRDQGCASFLRRAHLSSTGSGIFVGGYIPCFQDCVEE